MPLMWKLEVVRVSIRTNYPALAKALTPISC